MLRNARPQGDFGHRVHRGEHCCQLVVERRGGSAVALAREGERNGAVAERDEFGHDIVPGGSVEPQAGDEEDVHGGSPEERAVGCRDAIEGL
ncbi:hypothetical protein GCM10020227_61860 [Streptomyces flavovirens]